MSSNIPPNSPPAPVDNGPGPQPMWMPYGFVQFDGNFNRNTGNNQMSQPQGMSAYGGVIFQQPFQSAQIQNDPNRPNSLMIPPPYPLISSPPPPANFPNAGNELINPNQVPVPLVYPAPENNLISDQSAAPTRNSIHPADNLIPHESQIIARNSMISSPLNRHRSPPPTDSSGQQFQPVFQPMLVGWQPVQQQGLNASVQQVNQAAQQRIPDVIGYQSQIPDVSPSNISPYEFQHFPPDVVPGQQDQPSYVNDNENNQLGQPTYSNDGAARAHSVQPTPRQEEPTYMNDTAEDSKRNSRGLSLPPVISQPGQSPIAPPRSRRGSQRGSMVSLNNLSTQSLDAIGLSNKLKGMIEEEKSSGQGEIKKLNLPKRPPRKKDFLRKAVLGQSLPRSFKSLSIICEDLPQYDVPSPPAEEGAEEQSKVKSDIAEETIEQKSSDQPILQGGRSPNKETLQNAELKNRNLNEELEKPQPVIAQPGTASKNHPVGRSNSLEVQLMVPMPGTNNQFNLNKDLNSISRSLSTHDVPRNNIKPERNSIHISHDIDRIGEIQDTIKPFIAQPMGDNKDNESKLPHLSKPQSTPLQQRAIISPQIIIQDADIPSEQQSIAIKEPKIETTLAGIDQKSEISTKEQTNEQKNIPLPEYQNAPMADYQNVDNEKMNSTYLYSMPITDGGNLPDLSTLLSKSPNTGRKGVSDVKTPQIIDDKNINKEKKMKDRVTEKSSPKKGRKKHSSDSSGLSKSPITDNSSKKRESIYASPKRDSTQRSSKTSETLSARKENPYETVEYTNAVMEFDKLVSVTPQNYKSNISDEDEEDFEPIEAPENDQEMFRKHLNKEFRKAFYGINPETNGDNTDTQLQIRNEESDDTAISNEQIEKCVEHEKEDDSPNKPVLMDFDDSEEDDETSESETETLDVTLDMDNDHETVDDFFDKDRHTDKLSGKKSNRTSNLGDDEDDIEYNDMANQGGNFSWDDVDGAGEGMPPALLLHSRLRSLKLDLLSSIFQRLYPTEADCMLVCQFMACPASLEEKYTMIRLSDILKKNKRMEIELEALAEAMSQLAKIGQELMRPEEDRDPMWRSIPVAKEIMVTKGIAVRAPWEMIQGGSEILESLGYTEYTGFALQYPRNIIPDFFADHIGNLTVELVLASVEISSLIVHAPPNLETLAVLQEAEAFPGNEPEVYYPEVPMLAQPLEMKIDEELRNNVSSSLANIGTDEKEGKYDTAFEDTKRNTNEEHKTSSSETEKEEGNNDDMLLDGDATPKVSRVPQPGSGRRRGGGNESDYEEIGPPISRISQRASPSANGSYPASTTGEPNNNFKNEMNSNSTCDLCGTATAIVRCRQCTDQVFCLACDDMYHRHPKRSVHQRKAIDEQVSSSRPPLPPKADQSGPIAPPRKSVRKGSIPDSPIGRTSSSQSSFRTNGTNGLNGTSKSSTLPRKMASSNTTPPASIMAGRPLPPPPPVSKEQPIPGQFPIPDGRTTLTRTQSMTHGTAPPALPAKNIHSSNMSLQPKGSFNSPMSPQSFNPQAQSNPDNMHPLNGSMGLDRPGSIASQPPLHLNYPPKPPQLLNSLQQSNPYPNNNSINRAAPNQRTDIPFQNGNQNRANSISFQNNPNPTPNNMMSNRNPSSSMAFQQEMFGNANRVPPQMHPQMRSNNGQFQGVQDRMSNQNPYPNGINGFSQQPHPGMQRPMMPNNISTNGANDWNPYHEEMQFPTPSVQSGFDGFQEERRVRKELPSRYRNRLSKLNKSSSLHDLAHGFANDGNRFSNDGVSWEDSKWQTTQSTMNQPTVTMAELLQQRTPSVKRSGSTKSLHQDSWQANGMPNPHLWPNRMPMNSRVPGAHDPRFNPLLNPMMNQGPAAFHRSMHELSMGGNPDLQPGFLNPFQLPATIRSTSPSNNSQKSSTSRSKKSSRSTHKRNSKSAKHRSSQDLSNSRPSSRNASRNSGRKSSGRKVSSRQGFHHSNKKKSSSRHHRRSETSEEEEVSESPTETTGEFFTGESDNDFVSLSSGSNPRKPPKKSWMCEHCTYMNNPGVAVCVVCSRTSAKSRGELPVTPPTARPQSSHGDKHRPTKNKTSRNSSRYASSEDESDEEDNHNSSFRHQSIGGRSPKLGKSPKLSTKKRSKMRGHQKTPLPKSPVASRKASKEEEEEEEKQKIVDDLEQDAHDTYYSLRIENMNRAARDVSNTRHYESSSETSSINNPLRKPNFDAPAPAKGILKKSSSNPQLTKLELEERGGAAAQSEFGMITKTLQRHLAPKGPGKVIDIKKYLDQTRHSPSVTSNGVDNGDIWHNEKSNWIRTVGDERDRYSPPKSSILNEPEAEYLSDVETNAGGRMYRAVSGLSLGEHEGFVEHDSNKQAQRRSSEAGKRNFRSKRFSRNLERDPIARRSNSLQVNRSRLPNDEMPESTQTWVDTQKGTIRTKQRSHLNSESSSEEAPLHYTAKIEAASKGPGGIGSYLAKQEFGSADGQPPVPGNPDSGYVSHGSGGAYPKMQLPTQEPMESFTMSVDRGFLGRTPGDRDPGQYRSMDDLAVQKTTGLELVRLLRDAEQAGFTAEDIQVSLNHCGEANPVMWLNENWDNMMETVMTLASNVGHEKDENTIGTLSKAEAKEALRTHKGNIWAAVTECVEQRQKKYDELCSKGNFTREDIVTVLTAHQGNVEAAFQELNKAQLKPFLMRIWGQPEPGEVESGQDINALNPEASNETKDFNDGDSLQASADDKTNFESVKVESKSTRLVNGVVEESEHVNVSASVRSFSGNNEEAVDSSNAKATIQKKVIEYVEESDEDVDEEEEEEEPANQENDDDGSPKATNFDFDRRVRRLLAEGKITSYDKGELAVKLKDMEFEEDEALLAADNCENVYSATKFLHQECELCASRMNVKEIFSMLSCEHKCCRDCASRHFTIIITDRSISELVCPFCQKPEKLAEDDELAADYFAKLDILLKSLVDQPTHDLFQRKLRDRTLMKDPNFKWCYKCPFGFIADPKNKKLVCPDCRAMSCAKCLVPWEPQHEGVSCEDFAAWKEANDPDNQADGLKRHLDEHGMECPACKFKYTLSRGGCMHFTCTQCKHEFCIGCYKPFKMGVKCGKGAGCARMGLHAHHPRNCLFYLRDKEPADLQKLLRTNKIEYKTDPTEASNTRCPVQVQKETKTGMEDAVCGELSPKGYGGYCKQHYVEYLGKLVFNHEIDPAPILDQEELEAILKRADKRLPSRYGITPEVWKEKLLNLILHEIPLDSA